MLIALVFGVALQFFVIEAPGVSKVFSTQNLNAVEWVITACLSVLPLVVHEIIVLINYIKRKKLEKDLAK